MVQTLDVPLDGSGRRIAIAASRFTESITRRLLDGAVRTLEELGVAGDDIVVGWVPGAFELPLLCDAFARTADYDGVLALGCVIRGETSHYDYVCLGATRGVLDTSLRYGIPVVFGVLTTEDREQAMARSGGAKGDKGAECARAVLEMAGALSVLRT
ncbi:MAG: 6,7-dimethyl-8-ribityllumazine synthase [Planctomycetes bacterium]|nr:6,7-dimethyl-8-ribityllumazine synthase [Planctomycetota bacterium]MCB9871882.1 6,7-dimethyl-8-ribityllumazine synthase [Planctomycetota bacterium]MCB9888832.1 6,7-dimethyl-8-ribityllumazine synthase [Planctomycetota bacterium]